MLEKQRRNQSLIQFALAVVVLVALNFLANSRIGGTPLYGALDLTEDKRFTLTEATVRQVEAIGEPMLIRVLLAGELPPTYERLQQATEELLLDFQGLNPRIEFEFVDPLAGPPEEVQERQQQMAEDGIVPVSDFTQTAGERSLRAVYPYALLYYGNQRRTISFLEGGLPSQSAEVRLNQAESLLEYQFSRAVDAVTNNDKPLIGFTLGNGELDRFRSADLVSELKKQYDVGPVYLDSFAFIPQDIELLIVAKPTEPFTDFETFKFDQYVMNGGKVLWLIDAVAMDYDSLQNQTEVYPKSRDLNLDDLFFRYGFRLDPVFALDLTNTRIPIVTSQDAAGRPEVNLVPFPYHVLSVPAGDHPIVQNLDPVDLRFPTVVETLDNAEGVRSTVLLSSSARARRQRLPSPVNLNVQKYSLEIDRFSEANLPLAVLLEGRFASPFANRLSRENARVLTENGFEFSAQSPPTAMLVVSDGDVAANPVRGGTVSPLGLNPFERTTFANKPFLINAVEYLLNPDGIIAARGKQIKLRLMDRPTAQAEAGFWRLLNIGLPLLLLAAFGLLFNYLRRRRYAR